MFIPRVHVADVIALLIFEHISFALASLIDGHVHAAPSSTKNVHLHLQRSSASDRPSCTVKGRACASYPTPAASDEETHGLIVGEERADPAAHSLGVSG